MGPDQAGARIVNMPVEPFPMPPIRERPSPNYDARPSATAGTPGAVDMLVLHYTGMTSAAAAIDRLCDPEARVSSHYVVEEDGTVWRLVREQYRAWHAGISHWRGRSWLNDFSVGIEIVNPGHEWGYRAFPEAQMRSVLALSHAIVRCHSIPASHIVAHSDIAPDRKQDPGELFDWRWLAQHGIGVWPDATPVKDRPKQENDPWDFLRRIGYRTDLPLDMVLRAFQRRFLPDRPDGSADAATLARLATVAHAYKMADRATSHG
ncbi:Anhydro-N-acetylmuramyl-tripeptide amidase [Granulibacter bethesdensis]|nr:Anhydro-N-acetylmuramyl-tripeptide amidase [Granulibacter bethesdensis]